LSVLSDQAQFTVSNVPQVVKDLKESEHPHLIDYSEKYQFGQHRAIGVRALLVDQKYQGKGIATQAIKALPSYVTEHYPDYEVIQHHLVFVNVVWMNKIFVLGVFER